MRRSRAVTRASVARCLQPLAVPVVILVTTVCAAVGVLGLWSGDGAAVLAPGNAAPCPLFLAAPLAPWLFASALAGAVLLAGLRLWHGRRSGLTVSIRAGAGGGSRARLLWSLERQVGHNDSRPYSILLTDIDGFKVLNDRYGPEIGDEVLQRIEARLPGWVPDGAQVGRFGSDEFLIFLPNTDTEAALDVAAALRTTIAGQPLVIGHTVITITVSTGVASCPGTGGALWDCISRATSALFKAKEQGRSAIRISTGVGICHLGAQIEAALAGGCLRPAYQPIVDLRSGLPVAEEGLARILLPTGGILDAEQFMAAATELRLSGRIDGCLVTQMLDRCREQILRGDRRLRFMNMSAGVLNDRRFLAQLAESYARCAILGRCTGSANPLVIEITERELVRDPQTVLTALTPLLDTGVRLAIDDFGSGHSSFLYLTTLPVTFVKIEMALLQAARSHSRAQTVVRGIRAIAADLGMTTIAGGIEDPELAVLAGDWGLDWGQGFYYGHPVIAPPLRRVAVVACPGGGMSVIGERVSVARDAVGASV